MSFSRWFAVIFIGAVMYYSACSAFTDIARADYWECLTDDCSKGTVIETQEQVKEENEKPEWQRRSRSTTVWHADGGQTIYVEKPNGDSVIWHPDGSSTYITRD